MRLRILPLFLLPACASAQGATPYDKGDTAWMVVATALVLLMTPALALFYGGMVHRKNVLNTMLMSFLMMGVVSLLWVLFGYTLAFGRTANGFVGSLEFAFGRGLSLADPYPYFDPKGTIPAALFMLFQMKFAIITPALISGAIAERVKLSGYLLLTVLWSLLVYSPLACSIWNPGGWLFRLGALDFAGGTVVHLASGVSALALVLVIGPRKERAVPPNSLVLTLLGAGLLWIGWFGFNAGSALGINEVAVGAFLTTHLAAAGGMLAWLGAERWRHGRVTALGGASGLVAGLVGITPAAGYVGPMAAILIGLLSGAVCYAGIQLKHRLGYDDALDVVGVHGIGGLVGALLTGVLADPAVNSAVTRAALADGRLALIGRQAIAVGATIVFAFAASYALAKLVERTVGLRANERAQDKGLDEAIHGEAGYNLAPEPIVTG